MPVIYLVQATSFLIYHYSKTKQHIVMREQAMRKKMRFHAERGLYSRSIQRDDTAGGQIYCPDGLLC